MQVLLPETLEILDATAGYKMKGAEGERNRRNVFRFLHQNTEWMDNGHSRVLRVEGSDDELVTVDHAFDAWLSALTAWAHDRDKTLPWNEVDGMDRRTVDIEGHILVLR